MLLGKVELLSMPGSEISTAAGPRSEILTSYGKIELRSCQNSTTGRAAIKIN